MREKRSAKSSLGSGYDKPMSTKVIADVLDAPMIPARRPSERIQRIFTGIFFGAFFGSMITILTWGNSIKLIGYTIPFVAAILIALIGLGLFFAAKKREPDLSVPVVAKVLGTDEPMSLRTLRSGALACPVVVRPLDGDDFRSIVAIKGEGKKKPHDLKVGSLLALSQVEPGCGDLVPAQASDAQRELMQKWSKNPRMVSNRAPILPLRRGALERSPISSAVEFYGGILVGAIGLMALILGIAG